MLNLTKMIEFRNLSNVFWILLVIGGIFFSGVTSAENYSVRQISPNFGFLEVALDVPQNNSIGSRKLFLRGEAWGLKSQVYGPKCGATPLAKDGAHWVVPIGCKQVTWLASVPDAVDGETDASLQASVSFQNPRWSLLAEPTSLLRFADVAEDGLVQAADASTQLIGSYLVGDHAWRIPAGNVAPEFYVIGDARVQPRQAGRILVNHIVDDMQRVSDLGLLNSHAIALKFLTDIVFPNDDLPEKDRTLLVVWIGIDENHRRIGGAAGNHSFLANYIIGEKEKTKKNTAMTLMTIAHEQFHQLVEIKRSGLPSLPGWVNESLAQYYGLQSMKWATGNDDESQELIREFINPEKAIEYKFPEVEALYARNQSQAFNISYHQGATFWFQLDFLLKSASAGKVELNKIIPKILELKFLKDGSLPVEFLEIINPEKNKDISLLIEKYF